MRLSTGWSADNDVMTGWDALVRLKFDAATLSSEDLPDFDKLPAAAKAMIVLANVTTQDGKPLAPAFVVKNLRLASGRPVRVAIIGLLGVSPYATVPNPDASPNNLPWKVSNPSTALQTVLPEAKKKADLTVVLYSGNRDTARKLIQATPGIDVMVVGLEGSVDQQAEKVNDTALVQNAERGRYGATLGVSLDKNRRPTAFELKNVTLDDSFALDPSMADLLKGYHDRQTHPPTTAVAGNTLPGNAGGFNTTPTPTTPINTSGVPVKSRYAGSFTCGGCHAEEYNQWKMTKHAVAMASLERAQDGVAARRADCVGCHVVAYGQPDGYNLSQPRWDLKGVGCESCHGPAQAHVEAKLKKVADTSNITRMPSKSTCTTCHTPDRSPGFDYNTFLPKVMHKAAKA